MKIQLLKLNQNYFSLNSRYLLWGRVIFGLGLILRQFERIDFLVLFSKRVPSLYTTDFNFLDLATYSLVDGHIGIKYIFYSFAILLSLNFIWGKYAFKSTCLLLFGVIWLTFQDRIYVGKGLRIIFPMLLMFPLFPQIELTKKNLLDKTRIFTAPIIKYFHLYLSTIYVISFFKKSDPIWREEGTALIYFIMSTQWRLDWAEWLLNFPTLLIIGNWAGFILELSAILLVISGFFKLNRKVKNIFCSIFIVFHLIVGVVSILHVFSISMLICWIILLRSRDESEIQEYKTFKPAHYICMIYISFSIFIWTFYRKTYSDFSIANVNILQTIKSYTLGQNWALVAPGPGVYNYWFQIYRVKNNAREILYSAVEDKERAHSDAYFTTAAYTERLMDHYVRSYCKEDDVELYGTYRRFKMNIESMNNEYLDERIIKVSCL